MWGGIPGSFPEDLSGTSEAYESIKGSGHDGEGIPGESTRECWEGAGHRCRAFWRREMAMSEELVTP